MKTSGRGTETTSCGSFTDPTCKSGGRIESLLSARASASSWTVLHQTKSHRPRVVDCEAEPSILRLRTHAWPESRHRVLTPDNQLSVSFLLPLTLTPANRSAVYCGSLLCEGFHAKDWFRANFPFPQPTVYPISCGWVVYLSLERRGRSRSSYRRGVRIDCLKS